MDFSVIVRGRKFESFMKCEKNIPFFLIFLFNSLKMLIEV